MKLNLSQVDRHVGIWRNDLFRCNFLPRFAHICWNWFAWLMFTVYGSRTDVLWLWQTAEDCKQLMVFPEASSWFHPGSINGDIQSSLMLEQCRCSRPSVFKVQRSCMLPKASSPASGPFARVHTPCISKLGRWIMVIMVVMGINVVMKIGSNGSNWSNHVVMSHRMDHGIMKQSIVVIR